MCATRNLNVEGQICRNAHIPAPASGAQRALFRSVKANGTIGGPIDGHVVTAVVKAAAATVGFSPEKIGGHSLRAGFVTQVPFRRRRSCHHAPCINHRDPKTLEIYARESAPLVGNAVTQLGL